MMDNIFVIYIPFHSTARVLVNKVTCYTQTIRKFQNSYNLGVNAVFQCCFSFTSIVDDDNGGDVDDDKMTTLASMMLWFSNWWPQSHAAVDINDW
jgi:hypothetical protein